MSSSFNPKWIALVALILQNSGLAILMRYTMIFVTPGAARYLPSTAVLSAEIMKLVISLALCFIVDSGRSYATFQSTLVNEFTSNRGDWFKLMVPSILYTVQNSLQYFSMSRLSAPVFQVLYQLKIVTTAVFSVVILSRRISGLQWLSVVMLTGGVALVQLSQNAATTDKKADSLAGLVSVLFGCLTSGFAGCLTSGFAGVYFEMVLKSSKASIWLRNIQLSVIGIVMSVAACYARDYDELLRRGSFFVGYDEYVWGVIILQAAGGLIVAVVVKYADNVMKGFATSISILISCLFSSYLFHDVNVNAAFATGACVVLLSVFAFGYQPTVSASSTLGTKTLST